MEQGPPKKKKYLGNPTIRGFEKTLLTLVLPFLFPGFYGDRVDLAFRTYLSLAGTCCRLRYWNLLRRWIAYTSPPKLRDRLRLHSFWCPMKPSEISQEQDNMRFQLELRDEFIDIPHPVFRSCYLKNAFMEQQEGNFEKNIGGNPFFDVIECLCDSDEFMDMSRTITCISAASFSELCLVVYSLAFEDPAPPSGPPETSAFLISCRWKVPQNQGYFYIAKDMIMSVIQRRILGWLRRVGAYAPQDIGFHHGRMPTNAFGLFLELSNTNGKRGGKTPFERIEQFVHAWFPIHILSSNPVPPAYDFPFQFHN